MSNRIGRPSFVPTPSTGVTPKRPALTAGEKTSSARAVDQFDARASRAATLLTGASATTAPVPVSSKALDIQPQVHEATGYEARFEQGGRKASAAVAEHGRVQLPTGSGRGPSFHAEAGKPLTVSADPARFSSSYEKVELVWRLYPGGTENVVPMSDGTRDANGRLAIQPATFDVPADASGLVRLSFRTTDKSGRVSNQWDPSNDASVAAREGATVSFTEDFQTQVDGTLRAGDSLRIAYDQDRLKAIAGGKTPSEVVACVSFNGEPAIEVPLDIRPDQAGQSGGMFLPSLRVPFEATNVALWFRGKADDGTSWDSASGQNFQFSVGVAHDDADPSWKNELLRSKSFPNLTEDTFVGIGPSSQRYNCIAWTVGKRNEWVWPGTRVEDFDALYAQQGYEPLDSVDLSHDPTLEKVVIYGRKPATGKGPIEVTHGALMDEQGRFTSKIGTQPLIRHESADDLTGPSYGAPVRVYVRPRQPAVSVS
ncbi:DUF6209 family protein [Myxococcus sp. K15C18031901]|uniref:DUF6209 family protein n=1 Tax=Myxococcus dinghuensis TaxID=2906761 RepID=UPI0020A811A8|nr:DUF6209 family protein [Myxococcus dinghuensis]MCP3104622.1 DUF6209 family protein [Myxococcus dinghuensis]